MNRRGFTLIEVLVSLTLLTVVLGAVYSSFFAVQRAVERFDNVSLKYHEARTALDMIRREIEGAIPIDEEVNKNRPEPLTYFKVTDRDIFGKSASSMDFTAFSFKGYTTNALSYFLKAHNGRLNLYKKEGPAALDEHGYTIEMIEGVEGFSVETLFRGKWVKTWDSEETDELPPTVRITLEIDDNGKIVAFTEYASPKSGRKL